MFCLVFEASFYRVESISKISVSRRSKWSKYFQRLFLISTFKSAIPVLSGISLLLFRSRQLKFWAFIKYIFTIVPPTWVSTLCTKIWCIHVQCIFHLQGNQTQDHKLGITFKNMFWMKFVFSLVLLIDTKVLSICFILRHTHIRWTLHLIIQIVSGIGMRGCVQSY